MLFCVTLFLKLTQIGKSTPKQMRQSLEDANFYSETLLNKENGHLFKIISNCLK